MFISAKMWVPNTTDPDEGSGVLPVNITTELNDSDQIFIDLSTSDDTNLQLEIGEHSAMLFAIELIKMSAVSRGMREADLEAAMKNLNRALEGDETEEE